MNHNADKISICIPIYGVEKYIERCAISLFEQTYSNIEYIFVNDCTIDNSVNILKSTINRYPNRINQIKIINHKQNMGLGAARNTGIENATGEFIIHIDSDDFVEINIVEELVKQQKINNADIVSCGYLAHHKLKTDIYQPFNSYNIEDTISQILSRNITVAIWGRLIRKSLYQNHDIKVPQGINMGEDYVTIPKLLYYAKKIDFVNYSLYHYDCYNSNSYTASFSEKNVNQVLNCFNELKIFFQNKDYSYSKEIDIAILKYAANSMLNCFRKDKELTKLCQNLKHITSNIDTQLYKHVKFSNRIALYINNILVLKLYVKITDSLRFL